MKSNLQIISGKYRGRKLNLPDDARPTQNRARIALFNMLDSLKIKTNVVWDAFAGSGAFGIEFLSRYETRVIFTDLSDASIKTIKSNLVRIAGDYLVERTNTIDAVKKHGAVSDLVFIDPPYANAELGLDLVNKLSKIAKSGTIIVWEVEDGKFNPNISNDWITLKDKKYGRARFLIIKKA
ncbi:MAG TPA: RsmD family RNA methyltransferase [Alphaproteobacteria bacterium]|nr:RsmD family RNA methyltransferase [Alphaproteobacteria bacterium]